MFPAVEALCVCLAGVCTHPPTPSASESPVCLPLFVERKVFWTTITTTLTINTQHHDLNAVKTTTTLTTDTHYHHRLSAVLWCAAGAGRWLALPIIKFVIFESVNGWPEGEVVC
ncbi:hypothetical protein E2C01_032454 [Portunus trituberculatus]|uniref:Secreted protein n=1 Tax=Portunus trituberculatus TaxID=210409 RepID=A0A5B7F0S0_PORTR|nr:hypothetical protein [Portunus trituberculatus]